MGYFLIAALAIGLLIPTCIVGAWAVEDGVTDLVNTINRDIRDMCKNADKVNEKILHQKQNKAKEPAQTKEQIQTK